MYDVVIAGAGPAGAMAAGLLASAGRSVLLLERGAPAGKSSPLAWVNAKVLPLAEQIGLKAKADLGQPFKDICFHNADFSKTATPKLTSPPGYLVDRGAFRQALVEAAVSCGAELRSNWEIGGVRLGEDLVEVTGPKTQTAEGRILLLAVGGGSRLTEDVLSAQSSASLGRWLIQVDGDELPSAKPAVHIVLGLTRDGAFGQVLICGPRVRVAVCGSGPSDDAKPMLGQLCRHLADQKILPTDLSTKAARATLRHTTSPIALEMDSHVGKHALVVGDTGGFVAAGSDEGIYPGMWSAQIAAEVVQEALGSLHSQDVLMQFDSKWRIAMADYLRPPNTDIQFLLPLIFSNQAMADRMAAAFFCGENI